MVNTILAGSDGADCSVDDTFAVLDVVDTLIQDGTCTPTIAADPLLGALGDNGGPTQTHALLANSPAINSGSPNGLTVDQRGFFRDDGLIDLGAFEFEGTDSDPVFANGFEMLDPP